MKEVRLALVRESHWEAVHTTVYLSGYETVKSTSELWKVTNYIYSSVVLKYNLYLDFKFPFSDNNSGTNLAPLHLFDNFCHFELLCRFSLKTQNAINKLIMIYYF